MDTSLSGANVPLDFAIFRPHTISPSDYKIIYTAMWRIAVPKTMSAAAETSMRAALNMYGPQMAGYVRYGDTLVPKQFNSANRKTLSDAYDYSNDN